MKKQTFSLLALTILVAGGVAPLHAKVWVRPYIDGEEIVGTKLERRYSTPEDNRDKPFTRWERSNERNGKASVIQQGRNAESYTLTSADAGRFVRILVGDDADHLVEGPWIGPVMTTDQAASINNRFTAEKPYEENVNSLVDELKGRMADAVYFTVDRGKLHGLPYAMVNNERILLTDETRPVVAGNKVYLPLAFVEKYCGVTVDAKDTVPASGKKLCSLDTAARLMKCHAWIGDEHQSPIANFRMAHMGEGLVVLSPEANPFQAVADRDLINEACNQLVDFQANERQMKWFQDDKFGLFIHWNQSSISEQEISWEREAARPKDSASKYKNPVDFKYDTLYRQFNPVKYDPGEWMNVAKRSGMKYCVLTTKHHDGFANFPSAWDVYTIARSPYKKDIVGMYTKAAREAGMKIGYYYSGRDWYHPYYLTGAHYRYLETYFGQVTELVSNYGKIDVMWFDSLGNSSLNQWDPRTMVRRIKQYQPDIIINNRMNGTRGGEKAPACLEGDYNTPECRLGNFDNKKPWESCMCVANVPNSGWTGSWSYSSKAVVVPVEKSIMYLVNNTVKGGNLLYNIGPRPDGTFTPEQAGIFLEMGKWLKTYGRAIYGTRGGPCINQPWGGSCYRVNPDGGKTVYLHVCPLMADKGGALQGGEPLYLDDQGESFTRATIIDDSSFNGKPAGMVKENGKYKITLPQGMQWNKIDTVIVLEQPK